MVVWPVELMLPVFLKLSPTNVRLVFLALILPSLKKSPIAVMEIWLFDSNEDFSSLLIFPPLFSVKPLVPVIEPDLKLVMLLLAEAISWPPVSDPVLTIELPLESIK